MSTQSAKLAHLEIAGPDDAALVGCYGRLLGWAVDPRGPGYPLERAGNELSLIWAGSASTAS